MNANSPGQANGRFPYISLGHGDTELRAHLVVARAKGYDLSMITYQPEFVWYFGISGRILKAEVEILYGEVPRYLPHSHAPMAINE